MLTSLHVEYYQSDNASISLIEVETYVVYKNISKPRLVLNIYTKYFHSIKTYIISPPIRVNGSLDWCLF